RHRPARPDRAAPVRPRQIRSVTARPSSGRALSDGEVGRRHAPAPVTRRNAMLMLLAVILAVAWILGFGVYHVASAAIHILLVLALVSIVLHFVRGVGTRRPLL